MYKYEMHLHSSKTSKCGASTAEEYVIKAKESGYAGMIFTNHFIRGNSAIDKNLPWKEFVTPYVEEWENVSKLGEKEDIDVLFGVEAGIGAGKECLIYGLAPQIILNTPEMKDMTLPELSAFVHENNGFIALAHPFRSRNYIPDPDSIPDVSLFDAVEVYNRGNPAEDNIKAEKYTKERHLKVISGGDTHSVDGFGMAGIAAKVRLRDNKTLVEVLKNGNYRLLYDEKLANFGQKAESSFM